MLLCHLRPHGSSSHRMLGVEEGEMLLSPTYSPDAARLLHCFRSHVVTASPQSLADVESCLSAAVDTKEMTPNCLDRTTTMSTVLTLLCLCSLTLWTTTDGKVFTSELTSRIEEFVDNLMQCRGVIGLSLAVVKGNETWTRGFGMADKASGRPVSSSTLFAIGSVTKAFTSTILAMLIDESQGKYTWQTKVKDVLGNEFQLADEYLTSHVTIKDLLLHRTGLATTNLPLFAGFPDTLTRKDLTMRLRFLPVSGLFRDEYNYNNWMYALAGRVAEVMGGASWEELLHQRIFQPLQMNDSRVIGYNVDVDADNFALPYVQLRNEIVRSDPVIYKMTATEPAIAIASSADDMAKWLSWHVRGGVTSDGHVTLKKSCLQEMYAPHMAVPDLTYIKKPQFPISINNYGYGYGWTTATYRGYSMVWHSGIILGYLTLLTLLPDLDIGIFISTNGPGTMNTSFARSEVSYYVTDLLLRLDPWLNNANACQFPQEWENVTDDPSEDSVLVHGELKGLQNFVGQYGNVLFGDITVTKNGSNKLLVNYGRVTGKLHKTKEDHVLMMDILGVLEFVTHVGNDVLYINTTFAKADESGQYQEILVSSPSMTDSIIMVFKRGVTFSHLSDPLTSGSTTSNFAFILYFMTHFFLFLLVFPEGIFINTNERNIL